MSIDRKTLESERRAALAAIAAHRHALNMDSLDPDDFDDIMYGITDLITALRIYAASAEVDFDEAMRSSENTTRDIFKGEI
jgi:hypothetical protein